jgi:hypothetical protein
MLFEFQPPDFRRVAEVLEQIADSAVELYPEDRDTLLLAIVMLRSAAAKAEAG